VLGPHLAASALRPAEVIAAYKGRSHVAGGGRLLKEPRFVASSWCVKKPTRLEGRLMVMTLAWLVYSGVQRRRRKPWALPHETVPYPIHHFATSRTLHGAFQRLEGMHRGRVMGPAHLQDRIAGLKNMQIKLLR
jgi:hypothetical protein